MFPPAPEGVGNLVKAHRDGDRFLQFLIFNEEFLVSASHQLVLITSLPFVHTARRSYRSGVLVKRLDQPSALAVLLHVGPQWRILQNPPA